MPDIDDIKRELEDIYKDYEQQLNPNPVNSDIVLPNHEQQQLNIVPYTVNVAPFTLNVTPEPINQKKTFNKYEYLILFILSIILSISISVKVNNSK
jgi:hypothetical protein